MEEVIWSDLLRMALIFLGPVGIVCALRSIYHNAFTNLEQWHRFTPVFPKRLTNGEWSAFRGGQIWRRKEKNGKWHWQHRPDELHIDERW